MKLELGRRHFRVMKRIKGGATVWGLWDAQLINEVKRYDKELVDIVPLKEVEKITGAEFNGETKPYFGAILTEKGERLLKVQ